MKKILLIATVLLFTHSVNAQKEFIVDADAEVRSLSGSFSSIQGI